MSKEIIVDISPEGNVKIEANGFKGVGCAKATEQIEIAIGGAGKKTRKDKPERFDPASAGPTRNKLTF